MANGDPLASVKITGLPAAEDGDEHVMTLDADPGRHGDR